MALNIQGVSGMADEKYPRMQYHEDGRSRTVRSAEDEKAGGAGWSDQMNDNALMAIRKATGCIAEVIEPITRTRQERTDR
jgi:hypothetical protein